MAGKLTFQMDYGDHLGLRELPKVAILAIKLNLFWDPIRLWITKKMFIGKWISRLLYWTYRSVKSTKLVQQSISTTSTAVQDGGLVVTHGPRDREVPRSIPARTIAFLWAWTNPACASPHPDVKLVPVMVWVNESGCSKRQSVNDQLTYNPMSGVIYL